MNRIFRAALVVAATGAFALAWTGAASAQDSGVPECDFPAQTIQLDRNVNITNYVPQLESVTVDPCGNVVSYTETLTRVLSAGAWTPVEPPQQVDEGIGDLYASIGCTFVNGVAYCAGNSPGVVQNANEAEPSVEPPDDFQQPDFDVPGGEE